MLRAGLLQLNGGTAMITETDDVVTIRRATPKDLGRIEQLLVESGAFGSNPAALRFSSIVAFGST